ncbi:hypothetical protein [Pseudomonas sp. 39167]|jgi:hypothetical protein|uniref:hypothetical protein n=1 Tax=Pseudomonas sp. 39167 TaxID=2967215 RepID=UPI0023639A0F|nr:hypothetical protein [Pseudomonas sp. 39167]
MHEIALISLWRGDFVGAKLARDEDDAVFQGIEAPASRASFAPTAVWSDVSQKVIGC